MAFPYSTPNLGPGSLIVGDPLATGNSNLFEWGACHGHYHFKKYAAYRLWKPADFTKFQQLRAKNSTMRSGDIIADNGLNPVVGTKRGFCVIDVDKAKEFQGQRDDKTYLACGYGTTIHGNQGISVGWADTYGIKLPGLRPPGQMAHPFRSKWRTDSGSKGAPVPELWRTGSGGGGAPSLRVWRYGTGGGYERRPRSDMTVRSCERGSDGAARTAMRDIREALRLSYEAGLTHRQIAASLRIAATTVRRYLARAEQAGLSWPLPDELDDAALERALFPPMPPATVPRTPPDFGGMHRELRRKGVTLQLLWMEYKQANPDGYPYSRFCWLYQQWAGRVEYLGACHDNRVSHGWTKIGRGDDHAAGKGTICESRDQHRGL